MAKAFIIRDFPEDLHRDVKICAALEGTSMREVILKALHAYVEKVKRDDEK